MAKPAISTITIKGDSTNKIDLDIRFKDIEASLWEGKGGFRFDESKLNSNWQTLRYKLVKEDNHVLLQAVDKGGKTIVKSKQYDYDYRYPVYYPSDEAIIEQYGTMFRIEKDGKNIKLFPIFVKEVKEINSEILKAIERYETENNLIQDNEI